MHSLIKEYHGTTRSLGEHESKQVLRDYGVPVTREALAGTPDDAVEAAQKIGYPVALKAHAPGLQHKTEAGAVHLDITSENRLRGACQSLQESMERSHPDRSFRFLVQEILPAGVEVMVGGLRDRSFGPVVTFGMGGVYAELFDDVAILVAPATRDEIKGMMRETRAYQLLTGFRGKHGDVDKIIDIIEGVGRLMLENPVAELDINPIITWERGAKAADALIVLEDER